MADQIGPGLIGIGNLPGQAFHGPVPGILGGFSQSTGNADAAVFVDPAAGFDDLLLAYGVDDALGHVEGGFHGFKPVKLFDHSLPPH